MRAVRLDYQRSNRAAPWAGLLLLIAALTTLAVLVDQYRTLEQQARIWESRSDRIDQFSNHYRRLASPPLSEAEVRAQMLEVKQANEVARQLSLPWNALFTAVESSGGENVALLSMVPDPRNGTLKISGEARNLDALLKYVKKLSGRKVFGSVFLQNHKVQQSDPERPLHFSLLAYWKGAAP